MMFSRVLRRWVVRLAEAFGWLSDVERRHISAFLDGNPCYGGDPLVSHDGRNESLRWFAIAQAPEPFALIKRDGAWYSVGSRGTRRVEDDIVRLAKGRLLAYAAFKNNPDLIVETEEAIDAIVTREGAARVVQVLREYAESLSRQASYAIDPKLKDQVESEISAIERYVERLDASH